MTAVHVVVAVRLVSAVHVVTVVCAVHVMTVVLIVRLVSGVHVVTAMVTVCLVPAVLCVLVRLWLLAMPGGRTMIMVRGFGRASELAVRKLGQSAIEGVGGAVGIRDLHSGFGCRNGVPQVLDPVTLLGLAITQDHQQIRRRWGAHTRPSTTRQLRLDGEPLPRGPGTYREQNPRPGNGSS
ncbi:hypothetical protein [Streptomyces ureilyticus]|uniref:hypothetical protein n=1 Tax=Streptomyces ureilyticus TaxID=1775131 RepID=UPI002E2D6849|nr:hypothetical protein [Streptomyces ureilyticus]